MAGANNGPHEAERNRWNVERDESHNPQSLQNLRREVVSSEHWASLFNLIRRCLCDTYVDQKIESYNPQLLRNILFMLLVDGRLPKKILFSSGHLCEISRVLIIHSLHSVFIWSQVLYVCTAWVNIHKFSMKLFCCCLIHEFDRAAQIVCPTLSAVCGQGCGEH